MTPFDQIAQAGLPYLISAGLVVIFGTWLAFSMAIILGIASHIKLRNR